MTNLERNKAIYNDHLKGRTTKELAEMYGLKAISVVYRIKEYHRLLNHRRVLMKDIYKYLEKECKTKAVAVRTYNSLDMYFEINNIYYTEDMREAILNESIPGIGNKSKELLKAYFCK